MLLQLRKRFRWLSQALSKRFSSLTEGGRFKVVQYPNATAHALPDFVIVGCQRCGTSSLYRYLGLHPLMVRARTKEIHYFDRDENYAQGESWYRAHFPTWKELEQRGQPHGRRAITGEATPAYIFREPATQRLARFLSRDVRLIVLLRNPVDRAYSNYGNSTRKGLAERSFEQYVEEELRRLSEPFRCDRDPSADKDYLKRGIYVDQLTRLKELCPDNPLLIIRSEDMFHDVQAVYDQTTDFLELPRHPLADIRNLKKLHYEPMHPATRQRLAEFFQPHNQRLYAYLGRNFGWR